MQLAIVKARNASVNQHRQTVPGYKAMQLNHSTSTWFNYCPNEKQAPVNKSEARESHMPLVIQ